MSWITSNWGVYNRIQNYWNPKQAMTSFSAKTSETHLPNHDHGKALFPLALHRRIPKAFERFEKVWDFDNFWKRANTFDACISFCEALLKVASNETETKEILKTVEKMLENNLKYFNDSVFEDKWADDFGWLGLMALNASSLLNKLGNNELALKYLSLSSNSWHYMKDNAYDNTDHSKPIPFGCRNNSAKFPQDGAKNTVVNALLLLLSTRLYRFSGQESHPMDRKPFLDMAYNQWLWFSRWFACKETSYLKIFKENTAALIGERPFVSNSSDYGNSTHPNWAEGLVWSGDQGLLIGGLLDLLAIKENLPGYPNLKFETEIKDLLEKLSHGVQQALTGKEDRVFHEPPCYLIYSSEGNDYLGGRGILIRYMDVPEIKNLAGVDFSENILETTKAIWSTRDSDTNEFKYEFSTDNQIYFTQYKNLLGYSDFVTDWTIDSTDLKANDAITQAVGLDFLAKALYSLNKES